MMLAFVNKAATYERGTFIIHSRAPKSRGTNILFLGLTRDGSRAVRPPCRPPPRPVRGKKKKKKAECGYCGGEGCGTRNGGIHNRLGEGACCSGEIENRSRYNPEYRCSRAGKAPCHIDGKGGGDQTHTSEANPISPFPPPPTLLSSWLPLPGCLPHRWRGVT